MRIRSSIADPELRAQLDGVAQRLKADVVDAVVDVDGDRADAVPVNGGAQPTGRETGTPTDASGSAGKSSARKSSARKSSAGNLSAGNLSAGNPSAGNSSAGNPSAGNPTATADRPADAAPAVDVLVAEMPEDRCLDTFEKEASRLGAALLVACRSMEDCNAAALSRADEWILLPTTPEEIEARLGTARQRALRTAISTAGRDEDVAEFLRYEELLHDRLTGFPTLPVMLEKARDILEARGELTILYIQFVWYEKIEEIYGWQKLDGVLESTAEGVKHFYRQHHPEAESQMMVSHIGDDDFILFTEQPQAGSADQPEQGLKDLTQRLEEFLRSKLEADHSEDIASLCGIYVGAATVFRNPKIRMERLIYRGIREASQAARGAKEWEKSRKISDLKTLLREGAVFMEYHPIIVTETEEIYGYEALARGRRPGLRSPEVLLDVASQANLLWELSRLFRKRAVEGIGDLLDEGQYLFMNVDPHDFNDPDFRDLTPEALGIEDPDRIVLEITERTAISDYPQFQEYLAAFRERGFRFAVDDAGSGYAGLGSIANLDPDYIKLDISLISNIDTNFMKQNLVQTLVNFARDHDVMVVAEGVERREEFEAVKEIGVHLTQGFLFHKPRFTGVEK